MPGTADILIKDAPDEELTFKYSITSYGADFDVDGLVKRIERNDIFVPSFQRAFVWNIKQASRFVESLLLGLPVPGIFLSRKEDTQQLLVIDGQQRLRSLQHFYRGVFAETGKEFALTGIKSRFRGARYRTLPPEDKRRLDDAIIHATIVRQDQPDDGDSSIYLVFARLNTGGTQLQAQEIRSALYHGGFNDLLDELNQEPAWRSLYGPISPRKRDVELILRFFALYFDAAGYQRPMVEFLNSYMGGNRELQKQSRKELTEIFVETVRAFNDHIGSKAFKPKRALNAAIFDSLMVAVARRLQRGEIRDSSVFKRQYAWLVNNPDYKKVSETATSDEKSVGDRISKATEAFRDLQ